MAAIDVGVGDQRRWPTIGPVLALRALAGVNTAKVWTYCVGNTSAYAKVLDRQGSPCWQICTYAPDHLETHAPITFINPSSLYLYSKIQPTYYRPANCARR